jgi:hypothetical protein
VTNKLSNEEKSKEITEKYSIKTMVYKFLVNIF